MLQQQKDQNNSTKLYIRTGRIQLKTTDMKNKQK